VIDPAVVLLLCACTAVLFGTAAIHKFTALEQFKTALLAYNILPLRIVGGASYILPACEFLMAVSLCIEASRPWAIVVVAFMLSGYAQVIAVNLRRGRRYIDCGCAGFGKRRAIASWMVVRNLALALLLILVDVLPWSARPYRWIDIVTVAGGALIIAFLCLTAEELLGRLADGMRAGVGAK
jgi:Methylamine utilisation protein MauE